MPSKRQKGVNYANSAKGGGPRSAAGKMRSSRNSYRHGLAASLPCNAQQARRVETLARKIAGDTLDKLGLEHARQAAHAQLDLDEIRRVKAAMINQALALRQFGPEPPDVAAELDAPASVTLQEPERTAEAIRRALPQLIKLERYENSAIVRRQRSLRAIYTRHAFGA
jgi:hypothetical protein